MGLDAIKRKGAAMGKQTAQIIKVNKYENPQMALNLISHICTASTDLELTPCFQPVYDLLNKQMKPDLDNYDLLNSDLIDDCFWKVIALEDELVSTMSSSLKIAVAGGYSAGKSSLLNYLTGIGDLLPTGVEPVSVVNTYLNCVFSPNKRLVIRGENLKDELVLLNDEVLACIQHSSKSKTYIKDVLKKIVIDVSVRDKYLDGVTFVDTPGYNNAVGQDESDKKTADDAMEKCDAIFWCIDVESGTITKNDLEMLKKVQDKPIVILYTKMDKKDVGAVRKIIQNTEKLCAKEFNKDKFPLAILSFSCVTRQLYATSNTTFSQIIQAVKTKSGSTMSLLSRYSGEIERLLMDEINASNEMIKDYEAKRLELVNDKQEWRKYYQDKKDENSASKGAVEEVILSNYNEIMGCADKRMDYFQKALEGWGEALDREAEWADKVGFFSDASDLSRRYSSAIDKFNKLCNSQANYQYYDEEFRTELYNEICTLYDDSLNKYKDVLKEFEDVYQTSIEGRKKEEELVKLLGKYRFQLVATLKDSYNRAVKAVKQHQEELQQIEREQDMNIFSAISGDDYGRFLSCFSQGVDLSVCNNGGFSPLTWAVRSGNNEMVKFFITHDADLSMKDKRGYNALETAAMCHYQDICEMLIEADRSLVYESQPLVKLADMNTFTKWIAQYQ